MKYISYIFIFIISILIVIGLYNYKIYYNHKKDYTLDVYTDTIYDYVIVTTVVNNGNNIGVNSIMVDDIYGFTKTK